MKRKQNTLVQGWIDDILSSCQVTCGMARINNPDLNWSECLQACSAGTYGQGGPGAPGPPGAPGAPAYGGGMEKYLPWLLGGVVLLGGVYFITKK
jgi:hypothetical protein